MHLALGFWDIGLWAWVTFTICKQTETYENHHNTPLLNWMKWIKEVFLSKPSPKKFSPKSKLWGGKVMGSCRNLNFTDEKTDSRKFLYRSSHGRSTLARDVGLRSVWLQFSPLSTTHYCFLVSRLVAQSWQRVGIGAASKMSVRGLKEWAPCRHEVNFREGHGHLHVILNRK